MAPGHRRLRGWEQQVLLAIAILRRPGAAGYLAGLVASEPEPTAIAAPSSPRIVTEDPRPCERVAQVVQGRGSAGLRARLDRDLGPRGS